MLVNLGRKKQLCAKFESNVIWAKTHCGIGLSQEVKWILIVGFYSNFELEYKKGVIGDASKGPIVSNLLNY